MSDSKYESLKLKNQLCFPLYAASRQVTKMYRKYLSPLDLTYTQYITMLVLWEEKSVNLKELGSRLYLDSGTLTPLLKKLESKGLITRARAQQDERNLLIQLTPAGEALREEAVTVPLSIARCTPLTPEEAAALYGILYKILGSAPVLPEK